VIKALFWVCVLLLAYTYFGYPALIRVWATLRPRPPRRWDAEPMVSLVIVAHNEAARIKGRLDNVLTLDYPRDRLEIVLASDGSTDGTLEQARAYEQAGISVVAFPERRGKPEVLNNLVPKAWGEIVVLADARQRFEEDALRALVGPFADPQAGAVSGELILTDDGERTGAGEGVGFYWRYEKFIRRNESCVDSTVGATGAIYALRRNLFEPIPEDTILDDVLIPMRIAQRGYRVLFEPDARAYDRLATTAQEEFTRKARTIAGNFQLFLREHWFLNPFRNRLWFQAVSHKGLRLLSPLFLAAVFGMSLFLINLPFYGWAIVGQIAFYAAALGGYALRNAKTKILLLSLPYTFCVLNWATVVAFLRFAAGRQRVTWERTL
jgi:poly-beta-1,6-N-acetyl-D-glucosamine synthase